MLFNSAQFLVFFPIVVALYFVFPARYRWGLLLVASAYFYMAFVPWYIFVLLYLIVLDYVLGRMIESREGHSRRILLIVSIAANLGTLFLFKYFNFFNENATLLADAIGWNYSIENLKLLLPIGLSFHIFQSLSYVIEVYRGKQAAERHLGIYALYVLFFPQLVAGPIERPQHLLPQLHQVFEYNFSRIVDGATLMLWGFFKKLVIADQLAVVVDQIYGDLENMPPAAIVIAVILFSYQLYCDFSGYSDIAIGSARVMGIELMRNFERPYASRTIAEFWRRWHISLSNWLRDYLFYPLALSEFGSPKFRVYYATIVTFILIGLWHGANWTFVLLGLTHGIYLVVGQATREIRNTVVEWVGLARFPRLHHAWQIVFTFILVSLSWVFFRSTSVSEAWLVLSSVPAGILQLFDPVFMHENILIMPVIGMSAAFLLFRIIAIAFMEFVERVAKNSAFIPEMMTRWPFFWRVSAYYFIVLWIFLLGNFGQKSFIYFQF
jgi:alginate O-acetyltransferase complex protein AlgI